MRPWAKAAVQGAACGLVLGLVLLIGGRVWQPAVPDVVKARRFEVVDAAGKIRASLGVLPSGAPGLGLSDAAGDLRVTLAVNADGGPNLALFDAAGKLRVALGVNPGRPPFLGLLDAAEKVIWKAP